jgi:hypothetical protein
MIRQQQTPERELANLQGASRSAAFAAAAREFQATSQAEHVSTLTTLESRIAAPKGEAALRALTESAEAGEPVAQFLRAVLYLRGKVVQADSTLALEQFRLAEKEGVSLCREKLAELTECPGPANSLVAPIENRTLATLLNRALQATIYPMSVRGTSKLDNVREKACTEVGGSGEEIASKVLSNKSSDVLATLPAAIKEICTALIQLGPEQAECRVEALEDAANGLAPIGKINPNCPLQSAIRRNTAA